MENLRNYMEKLQELYGECHGLYWNALTAWQISIFKFACPLNIFNYTHFDLNITFQHMGYASSVVGGGQKQPHADSES